MPPGDFQQRTLARKFRSALRGTKRGIRSESNFFVHLFLAAMVAAAAAVLKAALWEWCVLVLCVAAVLWAEMFNTALEHLAKAVTDKYNERVRDALDVSSAAVLVTSIGASIVGGLIFLNRLAIFLGWPDWVPVTR